MDKSHQLNLVLEDFIPSYAYFGKDYKSDIFNIYDGEPENTYYNKAEFFENKLDVLEERPVIGNPLKSQSTVSRFLSPLTLNDEMLLFHAVGTGKTCTSVNVSELAKELNPTLKRTLVLVKGGPLARNYIRELSSRCTAGKYIPENYNKLTKGERVTRTNKLVNKYYEIHTFETFAKNIISKNRDDILKRDYSNRVIIIDEVQNIRIQPKKKKESLNVYECFHRFLHLLENRKILLMSATPMKDKPDEFASIMNLILPLNSQLPIGKGFNEEYFKGDKLINKTKLKSIIRGRISYLRAMDSGLVKTFEGEIKGDMKKIKVNPSTMSDFQTESYNVAYNLDKGKGKEIDLNEVEEDDDKKGQGLYDKSRQASLFVFPDGSYGPEGFEKYVKYNGKKYSLLKEFENELTENGKANVNKIINNIKKYSSTYAATLTEIIRHPNENVFVYNKFVQGSGAILFCELLKLVGFDKTKGNLEFEEEMERDDSDGSDGDVRDAGDIGDMNYNMDDFIDSDDESDDEEDKEDKEDKEESEDDGDKSEDDGESIKGGIPKTKKFAIITGESASESEIERIIDAVFNDRRNKNGKYIQVIVGSQIIGEGKSLKNIRQIHIQTPHWNNSETEQAIGRGIRAFSHDDLKLEDRFVKVFRHASFPLSDLESIDYLMYRISELKEIKIKQIERICKELAIDCELNKDRNLLSTDVDGSRECEYLKCSYKCEYSNGSMYSNDQITDTYNLYYAKNKLDIITKIIKKLFRKRFSYDLYEIINSLDENIPLLIILRSLKRIIDESVVLINRYGFPCFLREENNLYFLVDEISLPNSFLINEYSVNPETKRVYDFEDNLEMIQYKYIDDKLNMLKTLDVESVSEKQKIIDILHSLSPELKEIIIESILSKEGNKEGEKLREFIMNYFSKYIVEFPDKKVSTLLKEYKYRCMNKESSIWEECDDNIELELEEITSSKRKELEKNKYGYYSIYDMDRKDSFKIKELDKKDKKPNKKDDDKRTNFRGQVCMTMTKDKLLSIVKNLNKDELNIIPEDIDSYKIDRNSCIKTLNERIQKVYSKKELEELDDLRLKILYVFVVKLKKNDLCNSIKNWFDSKKLTLVLND